MIMANISLKDIQFPGLNNVYKIPEVDNTLTQSGAAADAKKTGDELSDLKQDLIAELLNANAFDIIPFCDKISWTHRGVTFTWNGSDCTVSGTATGGAALDTIFSDMNGFPIGMEAGGTYRLKYSSSNVLFQVLVNKNGAFDSILVSDTTSRTFTIPADASGVTIRLAVQSGGTASETVNVQLFTNIQTNAELQTALTDLISKTPYRKNAIPNNTDFNTLLAPGIWGITSSYSFSNNPLPSGYGGTLICFECYPGMVLQIVASVTVNSAMYMRTSIGGNWNYPWTQINGNINNYTTEYYENTYSITSSPTITADTNNYLASTGDQTDRTADIQAMLAQTGTCHLGPGLFMVSGVDIPDFKSVIGSGKYTTVRLLPSVTNGYVFKLNNQTSVSNLRISGGTTAPTLSATVGTRHGILFEGTKVSGQTGGTTKKRSIVDNVIISNFSGGGITCTGTGVDLDSNIVVSDCFIDHCNAGIYIPYYSEFHRFSNCACTYNYYGCVNNGGNNSFVNCDFSGNRVGILIDNSTGQSPNNSHGTYSCCTVNHSYSDAGVINEGTAIKLLGVQWGEIFSGLQLFYGAIVIDDCCGVRIIGGNFGNLPSKIPITITDSKAITFSECTFAQSPSLTQSNNVSLKFTECYLLDGTAYNPMN